METKVKVIYSVVGFLGVLSIALFVAAEVTRVKASQIQFTSSSTCLYPNSPAFGLGLTAAVSLMVAQIIITIAAGCFYCTPGYYQSDCHRTLEVIFFVLSWVGFVGAFLELLYGAAPHGHHGNGTKYFGTHPCYFVRSRVFGDAALLSFMSVAYGIAYLELKLSKISNEAGIAKIHPQVPTPPPQHPPA
ncbi:hypothetical protein Vadar_022903 [Vaccinium darrowii]|uniref:Uncharacterized protein n=1 Tax=Vaccinium darrowii TaxID=229202 RepID=A0ACB7YNS0_9ERIC|nr:hypothetical protein Vadar_022903 [Vaccinium darrowii]